MKKVNREHYHKLREFILNYQTTNPADSIGILHFKSILALAAVGDIRSSFQMLDLYGIKIAEIEIYRPVHYDYVGELDNRYLNYLIETEDDMGLPNDSEK